jgi:LPS sulfotransferase NodH
MKGLGRLPGHKPPGRRPSGDRGAASPPAPDRRISEPLIVLGCPRSGTTLLYALLAVSPELWSLYGESHALFEGPLHPSSTGWSRGNALGAQDVTAELRDRLTADLRAAATNYQALLPGLATVGLTGPRRDRMLRTTLGSVSRMRKPDPLRLLEKTPKNALRVPFLAELFPDARFVFISREPRANIASLIEGWRTPYQYATYRVPHGLAIDGYEGDRWNFALPPGWASHRQATLGEVCAFQYRACNAAALDALTQLAPSRWHHVAYERLVADAATTLAEVADFAGLAVSQAMAKMAHRLPAINTVSAPGQGKRHERAGELEAVTPLVAQTAARLGYDTEATR